MALYKKIALLALLIPSAVGFAVEPPVAMPVQVLEVPAQTDSVLGNLTDSVQGFREGIYKTTLGLSRLILSASKGADVAGNFFAEHYWALGGAIAASAWLYYYSRPCMRDHRPAWMNRGYQMWHDGRMWFSPPQP